MTHATPAVRFFLCAAFFCLLLSPGALRADGNGGTTHGDFQTISFLVNNNFNESFYNPGRLSLFIQNEFYCQYSQFYSDTRFYTGSLNYLIGTQGTAALNWCRYGLFDIPRTDQFFTPTGSYDDATSLYQASYAHRLFPFLAAGGTAKLVQHDFSGHSAYGAGLDVGVVLIPTVFAFFDNTTLDFNLQNAVPPKLTYDFGTAGASATESWPRNLRSNLAFSFLHGRLDMALSVNTINMFPDRHNPAAHSRSSFDYNFRFRPVTNIAMTGGYNNQTVRLGWMVGYQGRYDVYLMTTYNNFWGATTHLGLAWRFGQTREEKFLVKRARERNFLAQNALDEAQALYHNRQYVAAADKFKEIIFLFPQFDQLDRVHYLLGSACAQLPLPWCAAQAYEKLVDKFPRSELAPAAYLGLARAYAQLGRQGELNVAYQELLNRYPLSAEKFSAQWYLGKYLFEHNELASAYEILSAIPPVNPYYSAAQYYCACYFVINSRFSEAIPCLQNTLSSRPAAGSWPDFSAPARIALAHANFSAARYDSALTFYRQVDENAPAYLQSLVGSGWAYYMSARYKESIAAFDQALTRLSPRHPYYYEVKFLTAQSHYIDANYPAAADSFKHFLAVAFADSVRRMTDTTSLGEQLDSLLRAEQQTWQPQLTAIDRTYYKQDFYKTLRPDQLKILTSVPNQLNTIRKLRQDILARLRLNQAKNFWLGNAQEMADKANRAVFEAEKYKVFLKYNDNIRQLQEKLNEIAPPPPPKPDEDEDGEDNLRLIDDKPKEEYKMQFKE